MKRSFVYLALAAIAAALVLINLYLWQVQESKKARIDGLQEQIALHLRENKSLADRNNDLRVEIKTLRSPDSYYSYEEKAREDYGLIGQNETFFVLAEQEIAMIDDVPSLVEEEARAQLPTFKPSRSTIELESTAQTFESEVDPIAISPIPLELESLSSE